jgi:hypothetical protein
VDLAGSRREYQRSAPSLCHKPRVSPRSLLGCGYHEKRLDEFFA